MLPGVKLGKEMLAATHTDGYVNAAAGNEKATAAGSAFAHHQSSLGHVPAEHEPQQLAKLAIAEISKA